MNIYFTHRSNEQGLAGIFVVIGFIGMSLSMLGDFSYHYRQSEQVVMQELQARQAFLFAESALQWGITQDWELSSIQLNQWQCRPFYADPKIKSCLFLISADKALLQGQAESLLGYKVYHYQWISFKKGKDKAIVPDPNGWLDYCPFVHKECVS
ncbi:DUF2509 family protein [Proteus vulgaris]|uniref:DUF2509 family protein n=1 Tax=Proteus vulgaris TaxID=585 RepID=A0A6G6SLS3_PROVU|nr:DUF2509 family protein [Proteus vulgaris]QIF95357.1 DUF2509 family protein [Proteus vulgaris]CRL64031.1 hypothetical protein BN1805_02612 [Proteus vulgaris]